MIRPELARAFRLVRERFAALAACGRSFNYVSPEQWRKIATDARALAEACERVAETMEAAS